MLALVTLPSTVERSPVAFYRFVYRISRTKHRLGARLGCQRQVPFKRSNCSSPTHGRVYERDFLESQSKENAENARTTYFFFELSIDRSIDLHFQARRYRFTFSLSTQKKFYHCCLFICILIETNLSKKSNIFTII